MLDAAASGSRVPSGAAIASLYIVPTTAIFVWVFASWILGSRLRRFAFYIALIAALLMFLAWLSRSCSIAEVSFPPKGMPIVFAPLVLLDPIEVAAGMAIPMTFIVMGWPIIKQAGSLGVIVCGIPLIALGIAEWYVLTHYVLPHYFGCASG